MEKIIVNRYGLFNDENTFEIKEITVYYKSLTGKYQLDEFEANKIIDQIPENIDFFIDIDDGYLVEFDNRTISLELRTILI